MEVFDFFVNLNQPESNQRFLNATGKENIIFLVDSKQDEFAPHTGNFSFKSTFQGKEYFEFENHRVAVNPHNYLLLNDGQEYGSYIDSDESVESFTVFFSPVFVGETLEALVKPDDFLLDNVTGSDSAPPSFFEKLYPFNAQIRLLTNKIRWGVKEFNTVHDHLVFEEHLHHLLYELLKEHRVVKDTITSLPAVRLSTRIETYRRVSRAKDYLLSCYDENISINKLAKVACLAPFHFLRTFKKVFHITPHQMLTKVRLEQAHELLLTTNYPISQISLRVGFENLTSFTRLFTTQFGVSPRKFRQTHSVKA